MREATEPRHGPDTGSGVAICLPEGGFFEANAGPERRNRDRQGDKARSRDGKYPKSHLSPDQATRTPTRDLLKIKKFGAQRAWETGQITARL
jgi:hypothetical protein